MPDVFISYHEKSAAELAPRIVRALQDAGISCWYAPPEKPLTVPFTEEIVQAMEDSKVFLLILNEKAVHSVRVATETALAVRGFDDGKNRKLIAFRTDNCDVSADSRMSAFLKEFRIVDGCPPDDDKISYLGVFLKQVLYPEVRVTVFAPIQRHSSGLTFNIQPIQTNNFYDNAAVICNETHASEYHEILRELEHIGYELSATEPLIAKAVLDLCKAIEANDKPRISQLLGLLSHEVSKSAIAPVASRRLLSWMGIT